MRDWIADLNFATALKRPGVVVMPAIVVIAMIAVRASAATPEQEARRDKAEAAVGQPLDLPEHEFDDDRIGEDEEAGGFRGRGRGPGQRPPGAMLWVRMNEEERQELRGFIAEHFPDRYDDMLRIEESDPRLFVRYMGRMLPEMIRLRDLSRRDPELFEVRLAEQKTEFELRRLARRCRHAVLERGQEECERRIRALVEQQFDLRQRRMELEVNRLEHRLDRLRENLESRAADREEEIRRTTERILTEDEPPPPRRKGRRPEPGDGGGRGGEDHPPPGGERRPK